MPQQFGMELVKGDAPHIVLIDKEDGERLPFVFTRDEVQALREWCDYVLSSNDWWELKT